LRGPLALPLPISAGLGLIIGGLLGKNLLKKGWSAKNLGKICFFRKSHAIIRLMGGFGSKNRNLRGFSPGKRSQKPFLDRNGQGCGIISNDSRAWEGQFIA
jgi:hypothetical protein